jgi:hypothetical protein
LVTMLIVCPTRSVPMGRLFFTSRHVPRAEFDRLNLLVPVDPVAAWLVVLRATPVSVLPLGQLPGLFPLVLPHLGPYVPLLFMALVDGGPTTDRAHGFLAPRCRAGARGGVSDRLGIGSRVRGHVGLSLANSVRI